MMKNNFHGFFHYIAYWEPPPLLIRGKGVLRKLAKGAGECYIYYKNRGLPKKKGGFSNKKEQPDFIYLILSTKLI